MNPVALDGAFLGAVTLASLAGSLHCAGMCGGFVAFYSGGTAPRPGARAAVHAAYSLGRLVTYSLLGLSAGAVGAMTELAGAAAGIGSAAAWISGLLMIVWGGVSLLDAAGIARPRLKLPSPIAERVSSGLARLQQRPPLLRATLLGLSSTLLPCGWLYAFAVVAAGSGSPVRGLLVMLAFWLGTLPALFGIGFAVQSVAGRLRRHVPLVTALVLVAVGIGSIVARANAAGLTVDALSTGSSPACHAQRSEK